MTSRDANESAAEDMSYLAWCISNNLHCSLNDLSKFIHITESGLGVDVPEGNYDALVEVMGHLMAIKDRQATTDVMFDPLKEMIELLASYNQEMSEEVHQQLQVRHLQLNWSSNSMK